MFGRTSKLKKELFKRIEKIVSDVEELYRSDLKTIENRRAESEAKAQADYEENIQDEVLARDLAIEKAKHVEESEKVKALDKHLDTVVAKAFGK